MPNFIETIASIPSSVLEILTTYQSAVVRIFIICGVAAVILIVMERFGNALLLKLLQQRYALKDSSRTVSIDDKQRIRTVSSTFNSLGRLAVLLVVTTIVLAEVGINIGPILAGAGVAGVAIGFGAQSLVKDILAGTFILIENQYDIGDVVEIAGVTGKVMEISLRRTVLRDMSGKEHHVPNGEITVASNFTKEWANVNLNIGIDYTADIEQATAILNRVAGDLKLSDEWDTFIFEDIKVLGVNKLADSAVELKLHGKVQAMKRIAIQRELLARIKVAFDASGIEIPYPHITNVTKH